MNFLELTKRYKDYMDSKIITNEVLEKEILEKMEIILNQIELGMRGEKIEELEPNQFVDFISSLQEFFLTEPLTNKICELLLFLTEIIYNWNFNSLKNKNISVFALSFNRLIEIRNRLIFSNDVMKEVYERYIDLANWQPPVFDLAIEYFDKLLEENEKRGTSEDCLHEERTEGCS